LKAPSTSIHSRTKLEMTQILGGNSNEKKREEFEENGDETRWVPNK